MKKIVFLLLLFFGVSATAAENLIQNGDFTRMVEETALDWEYSAYREDVTDFQILEEGEAGALEIASPEKNHAYALQTVSVEEGALYCVSADVEVSDVSPSASGAFVGIYGMVAYSNEFHEEESGTARLYFTSQVPEVTIMLSLGGYSSENTGRAIFRNVRMEKVESPGEAAKIYEVKAEDENPEKGFDKTWLLVIGVFFIAVIGSVVYLYKGR